MAITIEKIESRASYEVYDVVTTLNGDQVVTIPLHRRRSPDWVAITHREVGSQLWTLTSQSAASVVLSRGALGGSANRQLQVTVFWSERHGN